MAASITRQLKDKFFTFRRWAAEKVAGKAEPGDSFFYYQGVPTVEDDPIKGLTPETLDGILTAASEDGDASEQAKLFQMMPTRDPRLGGLMETRQRAVRSCDPRLLPSDVTPDTFDNELPTEIVEFWAMLERADIHGLIEHLLDALPVGYAGSIVDWAPGGGEITGFLPIHATAWHFDPQGNPALLDVADNVTPLADFHPNQFVFHTNATPGMPCVESGLYRRLAWLWFFKHRNTRWWGRYIEKFGIPFLVAKVAKPDYDNAARKRAILSDLRNLGADGAFLTTSENPVEAITLAGHDNSVHSRRAEYIDRSMAITVLGQVGSSEGEAGKLGGGKEQGTVRDDIKEADCVRLIRTIQHSVINPAWAFAHGDQPPPRFWMDFTRSTDLKMLAEVLTTMDMRAWRASDSEVSRRTGMNFKTDEAQRQADREATPLVEKKKKVADSSKGTD